MSRTGRVRETSSLMICKAGVLGTLIRCVFAMRMSQYVGDLNENGIMSDGCYQGQPTGCRWGNHQTATFDYGINAVVCTCSNLCRICYEQWRHGRNHDL